MGRAWGRRAQNRDGGWGSRRYGAEGEAGLQHERDGETWGKGPEQRRPTARTLPSEQDPMLPCSSQVPLRLTPEYRFEYDDAVDEADLVRT